MGRPYGGYLFYRRDPGKRLYIPSAAAPPPPSHNSYPVPSHGAGNENTGDEHAWHCLRINSTTYIAMVLLFNLAGTAWGVRIWRTVNSGTTWTNVWTTWNAVASPTFRPGGIVKQGSRIWAFYHDYVPTTQNLYYTWSDDGGATWQAHAPATNYVRNFGAGWGFGGTGNFVYITNWAEGVNNDVKIISSPLQALMAFAYLGNYNQIGFFRITWTGTFWNYAVGDWANFAGHAGGLHISGTVDSMYLYASTCNNTGSAHRIYRTPKGGWPTTVTPMHLWTPTGTSTFNDRPVCWFEGSRLIHGIARRNSRTMSYFYSDDQAATLSAEQTFANYFGYNNNSSFSTWGVHFNPLYWRQHIYYGPGTRDASYERFINTPL
jgi:hypothetical protein